MKRARGPRGSMGGWGRSNLFRGGARLLVGANPGAHRGGSLGATGTYFRVGPEGSVGKPAHRAGGCEGPLGRIPRRGPRPPNRSAEPPGRIPGSGSAGLPNKEGAGAPRRKTRDKNQNVMDNGA